MGDAPRIENIMPLPFSVEQFFSTIQAYNTAVWPAQVVLLALALAAMVLVCVQKSWSGVAISVILTVLWSWMALAYHLAFFTAVNPAAYGFSAITLIGALTFFWQGVVHRRLDFKLAPGIRAVVGGVLLAFSLAVYPAWSVYAGHGYPSLPTFGLPCPTTIFTIGLLSFLTAPYPRSPLLVPILWCLVGAQAVYFLGVPPDSGLIVAGIVGFALFLLPKGRATRARE